MDRHPAREATGTPRTPVPVVPSAAILMESVAAPHERSAELAKTHATPAQTSVMRCHPDLSRGSCGAARVVLDCHNVDYRRNCSDNRSGADVVREVLTGEGRAGGDKVDGGALKDDPAAVVTERRDRGR